MEKGFFWRDCIFEDGLKIVERYDKDGKLTIEDVTNGKIYEVPKDIRLVMRMLDACVNSVNKKLSESVRMSPM